MFKKFIKINFFCKNKENETISKQEVSISSAKVLKKYNKTFIDLAKYDRENNSYSLLK